MVWRSERQSCRRRVALGAGLVVATSLRCAAASEFRGGGFGRMSLQYQRASTGALQPRHRFTAGLMAKGLLGVSWYGYFPGLDAHFGASAPPGFVYDAALYPVGIGVWLGGALLLGVQGGVGVSGITARVPFGVPAPAEAFVAVQIAEPLQIAGRARSAWLLSGRDRRAGASRLSFGDEHRAELWVRIGKSQDRRRWNWGNGYILGLTVADELGETIWGGTFGYSIDVAMMRR